MGSVDIERRAADARRLSETLATQGVQAVAITIVDNAGVARVKTVPLGLLERAARWGIGLTPAFAVFMVNDSITTSASAGGPTGDLRLMLDPAALRVVAAQPGWAWAPADQYTQEGEVFSCCQRSFVQRLVEQGARAGFDFRVGIELEWFLGREDSGRLIAAHAGPGYGLSALADVSEYARDLLDCFANSGIAVDQFHPEYSTGQLEISLAHAAPIEAADLNVLARQTIRAVSASHGWRASFSPVVVPGQVGNGGHFHWSVWRDGKNLFAGGNGPYGMTDVGESFMAGVLAELPALVAVGAPSVASYLRLIPSHWAGVYGCWGRENREAAVRFVTGMTGSAETAANFEVKCFDESANPYLAIGSTIAAGLAGVERELGLPTEFADDPAAHPQHELQALGVNRLPQSLEESLSNLSRSKVIQDAMGPVLYDAFVAVRRAELEAFDGQDAESVARAHRWRY
jgi:glutamine synthetase